VPETSLAVFDRTLHKTNLWLTDVMAELDVEDRHKAYAALRATLHALRDRLTVDEAAQLAAQLPLLVRGVYYENWRPAATPLKERHVEQFLAHVQRELPNDDPEVVVRAVFSVVAGYVTKGEIEDVYWMLPEGVRDLWPEGAPV
jgi:uncharacterized protein (DUF2267 family)